MSSENSQIAQPWPKWLVEFRRLLPIRSQFILSGNIRDVYLAPIPGGAVAMVPLLDCLWLSLSEAGYEWMAVYDRVGMLRIHPPVPSVQQVAAKALGVTIKDGRIETSLAQLPSLIQRVVGGTAGRAAFVIDYGSRIAVNPQSLSEAEHEFFVASEKLGHSAHPVGVRREEGKAPGVALFNPLIWLVNQENDLPGWYATSNERVHSQVLSKPDFDTRTAAAGLLASQFTGTAPDSDERIAFSSQFATLTEGLSIQAMVSIAQLARAQGISVGGIADAVRLYTVGLPDNPWKKEYIKAQIRVAETEISRRVRGQPQAVGKTVDILKRSVVGLTGAQASSTTAGRPRGILFFAGPTGVGKTELAKSLTQLLFGDEKAYTRFDMSEFSAEHADARLLGAPPGYTGYDSGGELTNAIRERPFSVVLFDEIEKAHPRILDKFLQVLEDGRLTDGRGQTVYFSEAILIFTSNLGIFVDDGAGGRMQNVHPGEAYPEVERKVKVGISDHFKYVLNRPEILNRFGDNIVVFNFIEPQIAEQILDGMLRNVVIRVATEQQMEISISDGVRAQLLSLCTTDLSNGGRGIGNRLETVFINPLARALFDMAERPTGAVTVVGLTDQEGVFEVVLR